MNYPIILAWIGAAGAVACWCCGHVTEPAAAQPPSGGRISLFDGKTLNGWTQVPPGSWTVKGGAMASTGAERGFIYSTSQYSRYRLLFTVRHVSGQPDHQPGVLVFGTYPTEGQKPMDALGGIQFQPPNGGHWDYRKGHNKNGGSEFTALPHRKFDSHQWSRVELLVDAASGTARMAVAQPPGAKAVEVLDFKEPTAGRKAPIAWQMHNRGLFDEYRDVQIEVNPIDNDLISVREADRRNAVGLPQVAERRRP